METTRTASTPVAGATREGLRLAVAGIVTKLAAMVVPEQFMADINVIVFAGVAMGAAYVGKELRNRGILFGEVL